MEVGRTAFASLEGDIQRLNVSIDLITWERIVQRCKSVQINAGDKIQNQARVADSWIFLSK
ncbi:MAG: hypothetical protein AAFQ58_23665, partial [Pseudomonadota bacterium]